MKSVEGRSFYFTEYTYDLIHAGVLWGNDGFAKKAECSSEERMAIANAVDHKTSMLVDAWECGDLPKAPGEGFRVRRLDLQEWMKKHFPNEKPAFLFPELNQEPQEMVLTDTSLLLVISALLKLLKNVKQSQENVAQDASAILGAKFSDSQLTKIFAEANKALANRVAAKPRK